MTETVSEFEQARLDALLQLKLLDTPASESFDRITRMAAQIFNLPIAAVSLTDRDRQWFKSRVGVSHDHIPRFKAPCAEVACSAELLVVNDLLDDPDYADSKLAGDGIRFYAGAPLITRNGYGLGALCVLGTEPRRVSDQEADALRDLAAMVMSQIELQHAYGRVDPISGMPNRLQFLDDLEDLAREDQSERLAVLVDLARADQVSHLVRVMGAARLDDMVREAAQAVRAALNGRPAYHVASTQFAFLAPAGASIAQYVPLLQREFRNIRATSSVRFVTTVALGLMPFKLGRTAPSDVLRGAHSAAQDARALDGSVGIYSPHTDAAYRRRLRLIDDFGKALDAPDQLYLEFQPRVDLGSGRWIGAEALLRWRHPELGPVSPGEFIPLVEQTSLVRTVTDWVIRAALQQAGSWARAGLDMVVSINVSAANLEEHDLVSRFGDYLTRYGVPADSVEIELTESAVMADSKAGEAVLRSLAALGLSIAIDDFGTGYSSLAYLQRLPADVLKIDQAFVRGLETDERDRSLVKSMVVLAHDLGYRVVAEGIESEAVTAMLTEIGCDQGQGFYFGRPMHADALFDRVRSDDRSAKPVKPGSRAA